MQYVINLATRQLQKSISDSRPLTQVDHKRGDTTEDEIAFVIGGVRQELPGGTIITFGCKVKDDFDGPALVYQDEYTLSGSGTTSAYLGSPSYNTVALDAALGVDGTPGNDIDQIDLMAEITWNSAGVITSSKTFIDRVRNDVIKGDEDTPAQLPDPAEWLSSTGYNAGTLAGTETLDRDNGENQYGTAAVDFTLAAPTNGTVGKKLILTFTTSAILELSFSGIEIATAAAALLPITLEAYRTYVIRLAYAGDLWTLQEIYGPTYID